MAAIDDVNRKMDMLLDALFRAQPFGRVLGMGQPASFLGLAPSTYREAIQAADTSAKVLALLKAVNVETLGRIETLLNAVNVETLGRIERWTIVNAANRETLYRIETLLNAVNVETLGRIEARINGNEQTLGRVEAQIKQDVTDLNVKLDALKVDIQALPH